MKIEVTLRVTDRDGYNTVELAVSKLEVEHHVEQLTVRDLTRVMNDVLYDTTNRMESQLLAVEEARRAKMESQLRAVEKARRAKDEALLDD